MKKRFPEIEKEQFNQNLPIDLIEKLREKANRKGWSVARTLTEAASIGLGIDPAEYGIEADAKQTA